MILDTITDWVYWSLSIIPAMKILYCLFCLLWLYTLIGMAIHIRPIWLRALVMAAWICFLVLCIAVQHDMGANGKFTRKYATPEAAR